MVCRFLVTSCHEILTWEFFNTVCCMHKTTSLDIRSRSALSPWNTFIVYTSYKQSIKDVGFSITHLPVFSILSSPFPRTQPLLRRGNYLIKMGNFIHHYYLSSPQSYLWRKVALNLRKLPLYFLGEGCYSATLLYESIQILSWNTSY